MAIFNIYLDIDEDYIKLINEIYKYIIIIIITHLLLSLTYPKEHIVCLGMTGEFLNNAFMNLLSFILLGVVFYYIIARKVLIFV